jgi:thiosulfate/3-mercaptopyruvate sulfurtransferase
MISSKSARVLLLALLSAACTPMLFLPLLWAQTAPEPWTSDHTVQPEALLKELANTKNPPVILFVGFKRLYTAGHIKGAQYHGTTGNDEGLKEMTTWANSLPRTTNLVIYCGCCPMERCPNIRPAYKQLASMGFTKLRLLVLPTSFAIDWAEKGYSYDKGGE